MKKIRFIAENTDGLKEWLVNEGYAEWVEEDEEENRPSNRQDFIEEKKREFWKAWEIQEFTDETYRNADSCSIFEPKKWQLRMMYLYVLEEYCKEKKLGFDIESTTGDVQFLKDGTYTKKAKQAEKDMKPVLDKLKELTE